MRKSVLSLLICFVLLLTFAQGHAAQNTDRCTPITSENVSELSLFAEAKDFSEIQPFDPAYLLLDMVVWSPDSTHLSVWGTDFYIDGPLIAPLRESAQAYPVIGAYLPGGTPLAFQRSDNALDILNGDNGDFIHRLNAATEYFSAFTVSKDGRLAAFGDDDYHIQLWDISTGDYLRTLEGHEQGIPVSVLAFSPNGALLASGGYGGVNTQPSLWDTATGRLLYHFSDYDNHVSDIEFSPNGNVLAVAMSTTLALVNLGDLQNRSQDYVMQFSVVGNVFNIAFSPDGSLLAVVGTTDIGEQPYYMQVWDLATRTALIDWRLDEGLSEVNFSPDGCVVAAGGSNLNVGFAAQLWRVE